MMQVAAEDTHANYVICRGFDVRIRKFINYVADDEDNPGIPVAKPYGKRTTGQYRIGEVYSALLPLQTGNPSPTDAPFRFGQNPGVAAVSSGQPADLDETVGILYTEEDVVINWMLVDSAGSTSLVRFELLEDMTVGGCKLAAVREFKNDDAEAECGYWETNTAMQIMVQDQTRRLCGWAGFELSGEDYVRPAWCDEEADAVGSIGDAWLPSDAVSEFGTSEDMPIYEILWMIEPCEMFLATVDGAVSGLDANIILNTDAAPMITSRNMRFWQNEQPASVPNIFNWYVANGATIMCARQSCHDYYPVQVSCPPFFIPFTTTQTATLTATMTTTSSGSGSRTGSPTATTTGTLTATVTSTATP
jgi:hypothetical protein